MSTILIIIGIVVVALVIFGFIFRTFLRLSIALLLIYGIFLIGFVWSPQETLERLKTDMWLTDEANEGFKNALTYLDENKGDNTVIDVDKVDGLIKENLGKLSAKESQKVVKETWLKILNGMGSDETKEFIAANKKALNKIFTDKELEKIENQPK